jgi:hypothetical protein
VYDGGMDDLDPARLLPFEKRLEEDDGSAEHLDATDHNLDAPVMHNDESDDRADEGVY